MHVGGIRSNLYKTKTKSIKQHSVYIVNGGSKIKNYEYIIKYYPNTCIYYFILKPFKGPSQSSFCIKYNKIQGN